MEFERIHFSPEETLPKVEGGWAVKRYEVLEEQFEITQPAIPDALLDTPETLEAHRIDGYMPYWGYMWPTSLDMCKVILERKWKKGTPALELGTGVGLVGVAALRAGLDVLITDYDRLSVKLALYNAVRNGYVEAKGAVLDWRFPPGDKFPLILACDLIYELQNHGPLLKTIDAMLALGGECWLTDPGRHHADAFVKLAPEKGFEVQHRFIQREAFPTRPAGTTNLWILTRA